VSQHFGLFQPHWSRHGAYTHANCMYLSGRLLQAERGTLYTHFPYGIRCFVFY
jgi:hypothetical protein